MKKENKQSLRELWQHNKRFTWVPLQFQAKSSRKGWKSIPRGNRWKSILSFQELSTPWTELTPRNPCQETSLSNSECQGQKLRERKWRGGRGERILRAMQKSPLRENDKHRHQKTAAHFFRYWKERIVGLDLYIHQIYPSDMEKPRNSQMKDHYKNSLSSCLHGWRGL